VAGVDGRGKHWGSCAQGAGFGGWVGGTELRGVGRRGLVRRVRQGGGAGNSPWGWVRGGLAQRKWGPTTRNRRKCVLPEEGVGEGRGLAGQGKKGGICVWGACIYRMGFWARGQGARGLRGSLVASVNTLLLSHSTGHISSLPQGEDGFKGIIRTQRDVLRVRADGLEVPRYEYSRGKTWTLAACRGGS